MNLIAEDFYVTVKDFFGISFITLLFSFYKSLHSWYENFILSWKRYENWFKKFGIKNTYQGFAG